MICDIIRLHISCVKKSNEVPLGNMYLMYSWFFSQWPFSPELYGWQKKTLDLSSPVSGSNSIASGSENSVPLSVSITSNSFLKFSIPMESHILFIQAVIVAASSYTKTRSYLLVSLFLILMYNSNDGKLF